MSECPNGSEFWNAKHVLITGGLGFIGSNLAHRLVALQADVLLWDNCDPTCGADLANIAEIKDRVRVETFDQNGADNLARLVDRCDVIFNLAGKVSHIDSMRDPFADMRANLCVHLALLEACRVVNPLVKIVFAGTRQVYGKTQRLPVDESHPTAPTDVNGVHKLAAEHLHLVYQRVYQMRTTVLRLTNTYGARQLMRHNRQGFIAWFVRQAMDGATIQLFGGGAQSRDLNHVDDVVEALLAAAASDASDGEIYNVGSGEAVTLLQIAQMLCALCPDARYETIPFPPEKKAIDIGDYYADISKIRAHVGWSPRVPLRDGLQSMIEFYRARRAEYW